MISVLIWFCGHMFTIWLHMLNRVQKAHRTGRLPFLWSTFKLPYLEGNRWPPPYNFTQRLASALGPSLTRVPTMPCNTRGGDLTAVEKLEWRAISGVPRHPTGGLHAEKDRQESAGDAMKIRAALSEGGAAGCRQGDWVSQQLVAWC